MNYSLQQCEHRMKKDESLMDPKTLSDAKNIEN